MKILEDGLAELLVEVEAFIGREFLLPDEAVVMKDLAEALQDSPFLGREAGRDIDDLATTVAETVGQEGFDLRRDIAGECVAHLDRDRELRITMTQDVLKVLAGVLMPGLA